MLAHTAQFWAKNFISELILNVGTWDQSTPTPYLDQSLIIEKYNSAKKRLWMFDYDVSFIQVLRMLSLPFDSLEPKYLHYVFFSVVSRVH